MGFFKALDTIVHGGVEQPESYEKKKNYTFMEVLGKKIVYLHSLFCF
jgi:calcium/calmodulin-dependent protein kinase I